MARWETCSICSHIPASCYEFYKGGALETNPFPPEASMLKIIGVPYFNDDTSGSNHCIKRCPECGTVYKWNTEYEYYVNGGEDDINLTRLDDEAGEKAVEQVMMAVKLAKQRFKDDTMMYIDKLRLATSEAAARKGIEFFYHNQLVYNEDITPAIPALLGVLVRVPSIKLHSSVGLNATHAIRDFIKQSDGNRAIVDATLKELERDNKDRVDEIGVTLA